MLKFFFTHCNLCLFPFLFILSSVLQTVGPACQSDFQYDSRSKWLFDCTFISPVQKWPKIARFAQMKNPGFVTCDDCLKNFGVVIKYVSNKWTNFFLNLENLIKTFSSSVFVNGFTAWGGHCRELSFQTIFLFCIIFCVLTSFTESLAPFVLHTLSSPQALLSIYKYSDAAQLLNSAVFRHTQENTTALADDSQSTEQQRVLIFVIQVQAGLCKELSFHWFYLRGRSAVLLFNRHTSYNV